MKFDLELESEVGAVSITLNRDFEDGEIEEIVSLMKSLLHPKKELSTKEFSSHLENKYFELKFLPLLKNRIDAVRVLRSVFGCGLKEAKDMVEGVSRVPPLSSFNAKIVEESLERAGISEFILEAQ